METITYSHESCSTGENIDGDILSLHARNTLSREACRVNQELNGEFHYEIVDDGSGNYQINIETPDGNVFSLPEFGTEIGGIEIINNFIISRLTGRNENFNRNDFLRINTIPLTDMSGRTRIVTLYSPDELESFISQLSSNLEAIK